MVWWAAILAAAHARMLDTGKNMRLAVEAGGVDFQPQNKAAMDALRNELQQSVSSVSSQFNALNNKFKSDWDTASAAVKDKLATIQTSVSDTKGDFDSVENTLGGVEDSISQKVVTKGKDGVTFSKVTESGINNQASTFQKEQTGVLDALIKKEEDAAKGMRQKVDGVRKQTQVSLKTHSGVAGKDEVALTKQLTKYDKTEMKMTLKDEKNQDKMESNLEKAFEKIELAEEEKKTIEEEGVDEVENVVSGEGGLEEKTEEAHETVADYASDAEDEVSDLASEVQTNNEYAGEDVISVGEQAAVTLAENKEESAELANELNTILARINQQVLTANQQEQTELDTKAEDEQKKAETISEALEEETATAEETFEAMQASLENAKEKLTTDVEHAKEFQQHEFENKGESAFKFLSAEELRTLTNLESDTRKTATDNLDAIAKTSDATASYMKQAESVAMGADDGLKVTEKKIGKVHAEAGTQQSTADTIPPQVLSAEQSEMRVIEGGKNTLGDMDVAEKEATSDAAATGYNFQKNMQSEHENNQKMAAQTVESLSKMNQETAGKAVEELEAVIDAAQAKSASIKGEIAVADQALSTGNEAYIETKRTLQKMPEVFREQEADASDALGEVNFQAMNLPKSMEPRIEMQLANTKKDAIDDVESAKAVLEGEMESSGRRIDTEVDKVTELMQKALADQKTNVDKAQRRKTSIEEAIQAVAKQVTDYQDEAGTVLKASLAKMGELGGQKDAAMSENEENIEKLTTNHSQAVDGIVAEFDQSAGKMATEYTEASLASSKTVDEKLLEGKQEIQSALAKDTAAFRTSHARVKASLNEWASKVAALYAQTKDQSGSAAIHDASAGLLVAESVQKLVQRAIQGLDDGVEKISSQAAAQMAQGSEENALARSQLMQSLHTSLGDLDSSSNEAKKQFYSKLNEVKESAKDAFNKMGETMYNVNQNIIAQDKYNKNMAAGTEAQIRAALAKAGDQARDEQIAVQTAHLQRSSSANEAASSMGSVASDTAAEASGVDREVQRSEKAALKRIAEMDPRDKTLELTSEVGALKKAFTDSSKATAALEDEADRQATEEMDEVDVAVQNGIKQLTSLEPLIAREDERREHYLEGVEDDQAEMHVDLRRVLVDLSELGLDVKVAMSNKRAAIEEKIKEVEGQYEELQKMEGYSGADELERVTLATEKQLNQTRDMQTMANEEVKPKTKEYRTRIGQVFEDMGFEIDNDKVMAAANASVEEHLSMKQKLTAARDGLETIMHEAAKQAQKELNEAYQYTKAQIEAVNRMNHLSQEEKDREIRKIKAAAARKTAEIMARARASIGEQMKEAHGIDARQNEMEVLLQRAKNIGAGAMPTTSMSWLKEELAKTRDAIRSSRDKYAAQFGIESSFLEESQSEKDIAEALAHLDARGAMTIAHDSMAEAQSVDHARDQDSADLEHQLDVLDQFTM